MTQEITKQTGADLKAIAKRINEREETITRLKSAAIGKAAEAIAEALLQGQELIKAKSMMPHGFWVDWVAAHCPSISRMTATKYMVLARNVNHGLHLEDAESLRQAYLLCGIIQASKPKEKWPEVMEWLYRVHKVATFFPRIPPEQRTEEILAKGREDLLETVTILWPEKFA